MMHNGVKKSENNKSFSTFCCIQPVQLVYLALQPFRFWIRHAAPGFLKLFMCRRLYVCMYVCVAVVGIVSGRGISIYMCHENLPNKSKLALYSCYFTVTVI